MVDVTVMMMVHMQLPINMEGKQDFWKQEEERDVTCHSLVGIPSSDWGSPFHVYSTAVYLTKITTIVWTL